MPKVDVTVETAVSTSVRARQVSSMFDAPANEKCTLNWQIDMPIEDQDWQIGLIVGPSGSGKSTIMRHVFGEPDPLTWEAASVVDDFEKRFSVQDIAAVCQAVGFNTIPAWLRPFAVLSNGEKFRVELARRLLLTEGSTLVFDEFTSLVDRQIAKIGAYAVQKYIRKVPTRRFVAVTCHYDVQDWLSPDWVLDMATRQFQRRLLQRRPPIECVVGRLPRAAWEMFSPYHYMSADMHRAAQCYGLWVNGALTSFAGVMYRPHPHARDIYGVSRLVTLPDWQGLGLAMVLVDALGAEYRAANKRLHTYPAHPALVRNFDKSKNWQLREKPKMSSKVKQTGEVKGTFGGRPNAVFEYCGPRAEEPRLLD